MTRNTRPTVPPALDDITATPRRRLLLRRYLSLVLSMIVTLGIMFAVVEAVGVPLLTDPSPWLDRGGWAAVLIGTGLLVVDVVLPVPSSVIMVANGAIFGVVVGSILSFVGSTGAAMVGFLIGRRGGSLLGRVVTPAEIEQANRLLDRWGLLAIIVTRPVPLLAETMAIIAGTSRLDARRVFVAVVVGAIPASIIYAVTGALASSVASGFIVFVLVILLAGVFWFAGKAIGHRIAPSHDEPHRDPPTSVD